MIIVLHFFFFFWGLTARWKFKTFVRGFRTSHGGIINKKRVVFVFVLVLEEKKEKTFHINWGWEFIVDWNRENWRDEQHRFTVTVTVTITGLALAGLPGDEVMQALLPRGPSAPPWPFRSNRRRGHLRRPYRRLQSNSTPWPPRGQSHRLIRSQLPHQIPPPRLLRPHGPLFPSRSPPVLRVGLSLSRSQFWFLIFDLKKFNLNRAIYLGETFCSYISINNSSNFEVKDVIIKVSSSHFIRLFIFNYYKMNCKLLSSGVSILVSLQLKKSCSVITRCCWFQAEIQTERQRLLLLDTSKSPVESIRAGGRYDFIVEHDVKELGPHT